MIYTRGRVMSNLLVRDTPFPLSLGGDERLARAELRRQIGRLEHQLSRSSPRPSRGSRSTPAWPPSRRDPGRSGSASSSGSATGSPTGSPTPAARSRERAELETRNRELLERDARTPADFKWLRISRAESVSPAAATGTPARASGCSGC